MRPLPRLRRVVQLPYLRAITVAVALVLAACSVGALQLRLRHDVSLAAVLRYFSRPHLETDDLTSLLRHRETGIALEALLRAVEARGLGGMVYADRGRLSFHPHADPRLRRRWLVEWENRAIYGRLVPLYHGGRIGELVAALSTPEMAAALAARAVDPAPLGELAAALGEVETREDETRLLRRAGRFIQPFTPAVMSPSWLGLGDRLRFYESPSPAGEFVGQFAVLDPGWGGRFDEREARELSRYSHYLLITRVGARILLLDFHRGDVQRFDIRPFDHRSGSRLYRLAVAG